MARKVKRHSGTKVTRKNISIHSSLIKWIVETNNTSYSKFLQTKVCENIVDLLIAEFSKLVYTTEEAIELRSHPHDTLDQEFYRMARWMCESEILDIYVKSSGEDIILKVKWIISGETTLLRVNLKTQGYTHVLYDDILKNSYLDDKVIKCLTRSIITTVHKKIDYFKLGDNEDLSLISILDPCDFNMKQFIVNRWLHVSQKIKGNDR